MKNLFLIVFITLMLSALFLNGQAMSASKPKSEIVFAVNNLGSEDFSLGQQFAITLYAQVMEALLRSNHTNDPNEPAGTYPWLAERWTHSDDYTVFDVYLRKGIQFHKGWGEMTTEDLMMTFNQVSKPDLKSPGQWLFNTEKNGMIKSWEVVSKYHFRIHLSKTDVYFERRLGLYLSIMCSKYIKEKGWEAHVKEPIGTGPWQWVETKPGDYIKFEAVENHWRQTPEFKYLTYKLVPDPSTQIFMLQSGQINMAMISPEKLPEIKTAGLNVIEIKDKYPVEVLFGGQIMHTHEHYDPSVPWVTHTDEPEDSEWNKRAVKVRQALCLSINQNAMIDKVMNGYVVPHVLHDHTYTHPWHKPEWQPYPYDPEKAKKLLAEAGYPNGFSKTVTMLIPATPVNTVNTRILAELVAADLEALGLKIEREVMEQKQIDKVWLFGHQSAWKIRMGRAWATITPGAGWEWSRSSQSPLDEVRESPRWDDLTKRLLGAISLKDRRRISDEGFDYSYYNYEQKPLFSASYLFAVGPEIKGYKKQPFYLESSGSYKYFFEYLERAK